VDAKEGSAGTLESREVPIPPLCQLALSKAKSSKRGGGALTPLGKKLPVIWKLWILNSIKVLVEPMRLLNLKANALAGLQFFGRQVDDESTVKEMLSGSCEWAKREVLDACSPA